jgi:hypothetical protein
VAFEHHPAYPTLFAASYLVDDILASSYIRTAFPLSSNLTSPTTNVINHKASAIVIYTNFALAIVSHCISSPTYDINR